MYKTIAQAYRNAFMEGTTEAWKKYYKRLNNWAEELEASSPEALEEWALARAYREACVIEEMMKEEQNNG